VKVVVGASFTKLALTPVATLAVLLILGLVNFLVRYPVGWTSQKLSYLHPQSRQLVRNLQEPVKVWVFDRNQDPKTGNCWKITSGRDLNLALSMLIRRGLDWQRSLGSNNLEKFTWKLDSSGGCFR